MSKRKSVLDKAMREDLTLVSKDLHDVLASLKRLIPRLPEDTPEGSTKDPKEEKEE